MEDKTYLQLSDISSYVMAYQLSNIVWDTVVVWKYFERDTVGKQWVRSVDSRSANIAEGFGRYHKKDKIKFYRYAFGSLKESQDWCLKASTRKLIDKPTYDTIMKSLQALPKEIHSLIAYTNTKLKF